MILDLRNGSFEQLYGIETAIIIQGSKIALLFHKYRFTAHKQNKK